MRLLVPTLLVGLALAASAPADPVAITPATGVQSSPALGPDGVVVWEQSNGQSVVVRSATPGQAPVRLYKSGHPKHREGSLSGLGVAASATRTAFAYDENVAVDPDGYTAYGEVFSGSPTGPFSLTAGDMQGKHIVDTLDLSGDELITGEEDNTGDHRKVMLRDLASATPAAQLGPNDASMPRIAGPYAAYEIAGKPNDKTITIVVVDWNTGTELYRVAAPYTQPYAFGFAYDVQADGTLAILQADPKSTGQVPVDDLAWASPAQTTPKVLAKRVDTDTVRISGAEILYARAHGSLQHELVLTDLAGNARAVSFPIDYIEGADFDGTHLAYNSPRCIYASDIPATTPVGPPVGRCSQMATATRTFGKPKLGVVKAKVSCVLSPTSGCSGTSVLHTEVAKGKKSRTIASLPVTTAAGASTNLTFTVPSSKLKALRNQVSRKQKTIFVLVTTTTTDASGLKDSSEQDALLKIRGAAY